MSRVFAVLREESEAVSELKGVAGSQKLPAGQLANGAEGIKEAITSFGDARKSDIENERLPPDLIDAADVEGMEEFASSGPMSPGSPPAGSPMSGVVDSNSSPFGTWSPGASTSSASGNAFSDISTSPTSATTSAMPETPRRNSSPATGAVGGSGGDSPVTGTPGSVPFRRGHARQSSLGTTMTSPSTRRRSLEGTLQMIRQAMDAKDQVLEDLADGVAGAAEETPGSPGRRNSLTRSPSSPRS